MILELRFLIIFDISEFLFVGSYFIKIIYGRKLFYWKLRFFFFDVFVGYVRFFFNIIYFVNVVLYIMNF